MQFCFNEAILLGSLFKIIEINLSICTTNDRGRIEIWSFNISTIEFFFVCPYVYQNESLKIIVYFWLWLAYIDLCRWPILIRLVYQISKKRSISSLLPSTELLSLTLASRLWQWDISRHDRPRCLKRICVVGLPLLSLSHHCEKSFPEELMSPKKNIK